MKKFLLFSASAMLAMSAAAGLTDVTPKGYDIANRAEIPFVNAYQDASWGHVDWNPSAAFIYNHPEVYNDGCVLMIGPQVRASYDAIVDQCYNYVDLGGTIGNVLVINHKGSNINAALKEAYGVDANLPEVTTNPGYMIPFWHSDPEKSSPVEGVESPIRVRIVLNIYQPTLSEAQSVFQPYIQMGNNWCPKTDNEAPREVYSGDFAKLWGEVESEDGRINFSTATKDDLEKFVNDDNKMEWNPFRWMVYEWDVLSSEDVKDLPIKIKMEIPASDAAILIKSIEFFLKDADEDLIEPKTRRKSYVYLTNVSAGDNEHAEENETCYQELSDRNMAIQLYIANTLPGLLGNYPNVDVNYLVNMVKEERATEWAKIMEAYNSGDLWRKYEKYEKWMTDFEKKVKLIPNVAMLKSFGFWQNQDATFEKAQSKIAEMYSIVGGVLADIRTECPLVAGEYTGEDLIDEVKSWESQVNYHYYFNNDLYSKFVDEQLSEAITTLTANADKYFEEALEAQRKAEAGSGDEENEKLYYECCDELKQLHEALIGTLASINNDFPITGPAFTSMVMAQMDSYLIPLQEELEYHHENGTIKQYEPEFKQHLTILDAQVRQLYPMAEEMEKEEVARREYNKAAYDADMAELTQLQEYSFLLLLELMQYGDPRVDELLDELNAAFNEQIDGADAAYAAVAEEGVYDYELNTERIMSILDELMQLKEQVGIAAVGADADANVAIYNLRGERISAPARGEVNIFVDRNGNARKLFVK